LTGHCHLKGHLFKLGLSDCPTCERCQDKDETATHVLCECEALAHLRLHHLGQYFMAPSEYFDAPTYKILRFIRSTGLLRGMNRRGSNRPLWVAVQGPKGPPLIHTYIASHSLVTASSSGDSSASHALVLRSHRDKTETICGDLSHSAARS
jgi:hypothetical protein